MTNQLEKKKRANEKLDELKAYYGHLVTYIGVNIMITIVKITHNLHNGETLGDAVWDFATFAIWIFWGIGLLFHTIKVFSYNPFYGKDWEKRQIEKYIAEERKEVEKYKK
ncbi:MAG: 2TM domain-containing protein [Maribacter sp.]